MRGVGLAREVFRSSRPSSWKIVYPCWGWAGTCGTGATSGAFSGLVPPFAMTLLPMALDPRCSRTLGTVLLFLPVLFAMLFAAVRQGQASPPDPAAGDHGRTALLVQDRDLPSGCAVTGVFLQDDRLRAWFQEHPDAWNRLRPHDQNAATWQLELTNWQSRTGYQLVHSKTAIGSGGVVGQAVQGVFVESNLLPEKHNDFIFAMVGHQAGALIGGLLLLACYATIVAIGYDVATLTNDPFGRLVAVGLSTTAGGADADQHLHDHRTRADHRRDAAVCECRRQQHGDELHLRRAAHQRRATCDRC